MAVKRQRICVADLAIAANMAGAGASAGEIAQALGRGATAVKVYALLSHYGIRLIPKSKAQVCFPIVISREAMAIAETLASIEQADPRAMMADMLEQMLTDCKRGRREAA
jgi:hypothetical protein